MPFIDRDTIARAFYQVDASGTPITPGASTDATPPQAAPLPTGVNRSGTIATGGTAQQLAPANTARRFLKGQNLSTADLWINELGSSASASQPSYRIPAGSTFSVNTAQAISIYGVTTGQPFSATEG